MPSVFSKYLYQAGGAVLILVLMYLGLSGLLETYFPGVENESEVEWIEDNIQAVEQIKAPFSFAVLGSHSVGSHSFPKALSELDRDREIKFAIDLGDRIEHDEEREYFDLLDLYRNNFKNPILPVMGRHGPRVFDRDFFSLYFGPRYYSFEVAGIYFVVMDTSQPSHISDRQLRWLSSTLKKARRSHCPTLVFMGVPLDAVHPVRDNLPNPSDQVKQLLKIFRAFPPAHVFSGQNCGIDSGMLPGGIPDISIGLDNCGKASDLNPGGFQYLKVHISAAGKIHVEIRHIK